MILDLNGHLIEQANEFYFAQRFFAVIEIGSGPFIGQQGPNRFTADDAPFGAAKNLWITDSKGTGGIGRSSHHGIHGNGMQNVLISGISITEFELAGIALNGGKNVVIEDVVVHDCKKDLPANAMLSQSHFAARFLGMLDTMGVETTPFNGKDLSTIKSALVAEIKGAYSDWVGTGAISSSLLKNHQGGASDGNMYGIVLNVNGIAVEGFEHFPDATGNENIYLKNITIRNLDAMPNEILVVKGPSGKPQVGATGDVIRIYVDEGDELPGLALDSERKYSGTVLSDAQFFAKNKALLASAHITVNVDDAVMQWAEDGTASIDSVLDSTFTIVRNKDSMNHHMKGDIGLFCTISDGLFIDGVDIDGVMIHGDASTISLVDGAVQEGAAALVCWSPRAPRRCSLGT